MRRVSSIHRTDPLFEDASLPVNLARFPGLRQSLSRPNEALFTVRVLEGKLLSDQTPLLRVELVSEENDPFVLFLNELTPESFAELKEEQSLRVGFEEFSSHLVNLFATCSKGAYRLALLNPGSTEEAEAAVLNVYETTPFRELSHLTLHLDRATDAQVRQYLWERLRQENKRYVALGTTVKRLEDTQNQKEEEFHNLQAQIEALKLQMQAERQEFQQAFERRHADALREARLQVSDEERERREHQSARILELESRLRQAEDDLLKARESKAQAEAEAMRRSAASDAIGPLRAEANELRARCRELESRAFEESARSARIQEHVVSLERELELKEDAVQRANELLKVERDRSSRLSDDLDACKARLREAEQRLSSTEGSAQSKVVELDRTREELDLLKHKVRNKNAVIREQEHILKERENEIQRLRLTSSDNERDLSLERTKNTELRAKIQELKQHLEESAKMLEANSHVITYLNRELTNAAVVAPGVFPTDVYVERTTDY